MKKLGNHQCKAWIAIFAFLLQALLPNLLYAAAPKDGAFTEICTSFGIKKISVGAQQLSGSQDSQSGKDMPGHIHCPLCAAVSVDALPASPAVFDFTVLAIDATSSFTLSSAFAAAIQAANPRGPPNFS